MPPQARATRELLALRSGKCGLTWRESQCKKKGDRPTSRSAMPPDAIAVGWGSPAFVPPDRSKPIAAYSRIDKVDFAIDLTYSTRFRCTSQIGPWA